MVKKGIGLSIVRQCELLSIHKSGVYYKPLGENEENLAIMKLLDSQYLETPFYGVLKLQVWLKEQGYVVNVKRLRRLMKLMCWQTIYRTPKTSIAEAKAQKYPYLLRDLKIERPNQVWAMDITYIPMKKGFMYLNAIIDVFSRKVINWSVSNSMDKEWCVEVVKEALEKYGTPEIFNTDQGSQFTSELFIETLKKHDIQISMDGKGRAIDNIFIERLWKSVKYEDIYLKVYQDGVDLYQGLKKYFDFYNLKRPHQSLKFLTPEMVFYTPNLLNI
jgi:putative transposase